MKLITILNARKSLPLDNTDIDIQLKYKIMKFIKSTNTDEEFYNSEVSNIISKCAEKDDEGNIKYTTDGNILINKEMKDLFYKQIEDVNNTEIETPELHLSLEELSQLKLSVRQMLDFDAFINNLE